VKLKDKSPLEQYEEQHLRAVMKIGIFFAMPALVASLYYYRLVWPYAVTMIVVLAWAVAVDRMVDRLRDK
jgi:hypothetical protein